MPSYSDTMTAKAGIQPSELDYQAPRLPYHYADRMSVGVGLASSMTTTSAHKDTLKASVGVGPTMSATGAWHDTLTAQVGVLPGMSDRQNLHDTTTAQVGVKPTITDRQALRDTMTAQVGLSTSMTGTYPPYADVMTARIGVGPAMSATATQNEVMTAKVGAAPAMVDKQNLHDTMTDQVGVAPSQVESAKHRDTMTAQVGLSTSMTDGRAYRDTMTAGVGANGQVNAATAGSHDTLTAGAGMGTRMIETLVTVDSGFVAAVRAVVKATLPELVRVPESLPEAQGLKPTDLPFVVLVVGDDTDASPNFPVQSEAQQVTVELVYVARTPTDGATDMPQVLRAKLNLLQQAFLSDRRLGHIAQRTELMHTPLHRANQYQEHFANLQLGNMTVMVLTLQFELVQSTMQWAN